MLLSVCRVFGDRLGFKGGTCAALFHRLPRLSLDIDFDMLSSFSADDLDAVAALLRKNGRIRDSYDKRFTAFFLVDYEPGAPNIKVELNKRVWKNNIYRRIWMLGVEMRIADEQTLFTNKLVALTDRKQAVARDLFDVHYFLTMGFPVSEPLVRERTGKSLDEYLRFCASAVPKLFTQKNILLGLGELLDGKQKDLAKTSLIKETVALIQKLREKRS